MEQGRRRDIWADREIDQMLHIINADEPMAMNLLNSKTKRNKTIFEKIAAELKKRNITKNEVQIRNKFKSLKCDFYKAKRNRNISGAKRQTTEHFELLNEILGRHPAVKTEDNADADDDDDEMDFDKVCNGPDPLAQPSEEENSNIASQDESNAVENTANSTKCRRFKRIQAKGQSYQKVVESFTKDWKASQKDLLQTMIEQDESLLELQAKKQEELLDKSLEKLERILEKDREETAKMLQSMLNAMLPMQTILPDMFETSPNGFTEPSSSNVAPKLSPQDEDVLYVP